VWITRREGDGAEQSVRAWITSRKGEGFDSMQRRRKWSRTGYEGPDGKRKNRR
jgi:hypothetical protein